MGDKRMRVGEKMVWGNEVHAALAKACIGQAPLPPTMVQWQKWVDRYAAPGLPGRLLVEQQYAITKQFEPTYYKDWTNGWFRVIVDLLRIDVQTNPEQGIVNPLHGKWRSASLFHEDALNRREWIQQIALIEPHL